jgi:hypothetical protein
VRLIFLIFKNKKKKIPADFLMSLIIFTSLLSSDLDDFKKITMSQVSQR